MDLLWNKITEWIKEVLISGITGNLSGMFDTTNQKVAEISGQVGLTPQAWNGSIFNMVKNLSESVIVPIAGVILAFVMTLEICGLLKPIVPFLIWLLLSERLSHETSATDRNNIEE